MLRTLPVLLLYLLLGQAPPPIENLYPKGLPATLAGFEDDATLLIFVGDDKLGTMTSSWRKDGSYTATTELTIAGQKVTRSTTITPDAEGRWAEIRLTLPSGTLSMKRDGTSVTREFQNKTSTFETRQDLTLYDISSMASFAQTLRRYDRAKGGAQKFPVLAVGGSGVEVTLTLEEKAMRTVGGHDMDVLRWKLSMPGADLPVLSAEDGRILLVDVPQQKSLVVREGFESLRKPAEPDPLVSAPDHAFAVERNVMVPMRDGVKLATDLYRPEGVARAPVVLVRTPYKKDLMELEGRFWARRGYVYAVQDCRGRFASEGTWEPFVHEARDGYDSVEWLAAQPWSTGKVGMIGGSYVGWVQWWAASAKPPHLVTIIPNVAPPEPFYNIPYEYGTFFLWGAIWWADVLESNATADATGAAVERTLTRRYGQILRSLPVIDLDKAVLGKENPYWRAWIDHPTDDAYWQRSRFWAALERSRIPVFHQSGWFDGDGIGTKLNYGRMRSYKHPNQKLTLGPWGHTDTAVPAAAGRIFGESAVIDLKRDYLRWFDYWLKGRASKILDDPLVRVFVMNSNVWLSGSEYPLPGTTFQKLYLTSGGAANTSGGDGKLTFAAPAADVPPDRYTYDPADPTPDPRAYEEREDDEKRTRTSLERRKEAEEYHATVSAARKDMLVYTTDPLEKPVTIVGPVSATLYAASSAKDTDFFMMLSEVKPQGEVLFLTQGKVRARYRQSIAKPTPIAPGRVYAYTLDLWQTGVTIEKGSRLRVEVASASFPLFSRNLNTGGHNEKETRFVTAAQTIFHDARRPSHVLLPVIPQEMLPGR